MKFQKQRYWLASKILGGMIVSEYDAKAEEKKWQEKQLKFGNTVTLEFSVVETGNTYKRKVANEI